MIYRPKLTDPLNPKKLKTVDQSKVTSSSELKFFIDTFILGHSVQELKLLGKRSLEVLMAII